MLNPRPTQSQLVRPTRRDTKPPTSVRRAFILHDANHEQSFSFREKETTRQLRQRS